MRLTAQEKQEIIKLMKGSDMGIHRCLPGNRRQWNNIPEQEKNLVVQVALDYSELSPRELACKLSDERGVFISESRVYRILKARGLITSTAHILLSASDEFHTKTQFVHQMWQTDFTYFKIIGWGCYYLCTNIDDYSRYIVHWELCSTMKARMFNPLLLMS
jgi:transposase InsO family protein